MLSTISLLAKLQRDHPELTFTPGTTFSWEAAAQTIVYIDRNDHHGHLLHEVAHAALSHRDYRRDIELIGMECDAWHYAQTIIAPRYGLVITEDTVESALDSYRDWLHARSRCPSCQTTGLQTDRSHYHCPACQSRWHVNEARSCQLRRTSINPKTP